MTEIRCAVEFREDETRKGPGRLTGTLIRYGDTSGEHGTEVFRRGSLSWPDNGVVLREQHNRMAPIVRFVPEVRGDDVLVDVQLPDTGRGRDAATMVRNGTMTGLSVEFEALSDTQRGAMREIITGRLMGAGLVDDPSYAESTVNVRAKRPAGRRRIWL